MQSENVPLIQKHFSNDFQFNFQSTPVGSLQTGHEMVVSPNRDRNPQFHKVSICNEFSDFLHISFMVYAHISKEYVSSVK